MPLTGLRRKCLTIAAFQAVARPSDLALPRRGPLKRTVFLSSFGSHSRLQNGPLTYRSNALFVCLLGRQIQCSRFHSHMDQAHLTLAGSPPLSNPTLYLAQGAFPPSDHGGHSPRHQDLPGLGRAPTILSRFSSTRGSDGGTSSRLLTRTNLSPRQVEVLGHFP